LPRTADPTPSTELRVGMTKLESRDDNLERMTT
jgi:hypothetical protein